MGICTIIIIEILPIFTTINTDEKDRPGLRHRAAQQQDRRCAALHERIRVDDAGALALSAHILRHTLATNLLRAGVDIVVVAELLGHTRLDTTRRYTLPTHADLEDAVSQLPTDQ